MREREREKERLLPPPRVARKGTRGRCLCASSTVYSSRIVVLFTACGLSWFFPSLWVFHVTSCVSTLLLFSVFILCIHSPFGCGRTHWGANLNRSLLEQSLYLLTSLGANDISSGCACSSSGRC